MHVALYDSISVIQNLATNKIYFDVFQVIYQGYYKSSQCISLCIHVHV